EFDRRLDAAFGYDRTRSAPGRGRRPPAPAASGGGAAARHGTVGLERLQQEALLAVLINHPQVLVDQAEAVGHPTLASADPDKLRRAIIDLAADHPDLDSGTLKNQLSAKGFDQAVATVLAHTVGLRFAATGADQSEAAAGLAHIVALRGEREARREAE